MMDKYLEYVAAFKELGIEDKKQEIINEFNELISLLASFNNKTNISNRVLPVIKNHSDDNEFLDQLFTYVISMKEEYAKMINYITEKEGIDISE